MSDLNRTYKTHLDAHRRSPLGGKMGPTCDEFTFTTEDIEVDIVGTWERWRIANSDGARTLIESSTSGSHQVTREGFTRMLQRVFLFSLDVTSGQTRAFPLTNISAFDFEDEFGNHPGFTMNTTVDFGGAIGNFTDGPPKIVLSAVQSFTATPSPALTWEGLGWVTRDNSINALYGMSSGLDSLNLTFSDVDFDNYTAEWRFNGHYRFINV